MNLMYDVGTGPKTTNLLNRQLAKNELEKPDLYVLSHFHWDHSFGCGFVEQPVFSSQYTYDMMVEMRELEIKEIDDLVCDRYMPLFCQAHLHMEYGSAAEMKIKEADYILPESYSFDLGDVHCETYELENSHCPGSVVMYVKEDRVLFIGDSNSGKVLGYDFVDNYELLKKFYDSVMAIDFETIVLGHFKPYSRKEYEEMMKEQLENLAKSV